MGITRSKGVFCSISSTIFISTFLSNLFTVLYIITIFARKKKWTTVFFRVRGDFGITYDMDVLRLIDDLRAWELEVNSVVITRYEQQPAAQIFINKLKRPYGRNLSYLRP